jgi:hypothetical protein
VNGRTIATAVAGAAALSAATLATTYASADTSFIPKAALTGLATDNAGQRSTTEGTRGDTLSTAQAGGQLLYSQPLYLVKLDVLGEYERYMSAAVKNTYAAGVLDGSWRPDERTRLRSTARSTYAPDRYDAQVPYRLGISSPTGTGLPLFVRATSTQWSEVLFGERDLTERTRGRVIAEVTGTKYTNRRAIGPEPGAIPARMLQSRNAALLELTGLHQVTEYGAAGLYGQYSRADYEIGPSVHTVDAGALTEWNVSDKLLFTARAAAEYIRIPSDPVREPARVGWSGGLSITRSWERGDVLLLAKEGVSLVTASLPAAETREARLAGSVLPYERVEAGAYAAIAREHSMFAAYKATGTATVISAGGSVGWRFGPSWTARLGFDHARQTSAGLVAIPYDVNTVFVGLSFVGLALGDPPPPTSNAVGPVLPGGNP